MTAVKNRVFIGTSLDGYIADREGGLEWLNSIPNPNNSDMGYNAFTDQIDALVMGRTTFETVCAFDGDWPYKKPLFVLSNSLTEIPEPYQDKAQLVKGSLSEILAQIHNLGHHQLYIDGGATIQGFLKEDLIDDMIISTLPILLGGGFSLFAELPTELEFELVGSEVYVGQLVQSHYRRKR